MYKRTCTLFLAVLIIPSCCTAADAQALENGQSVELTERGNHLQESAPLLRDQYENLPLRNAGCSKGTTAFLIASSILISSGITSLVFLPSPYFDYYPGVNGTSVMCATYDKNDTAATAYYGTGTIVTGAGLLLGVGMKMCANSKARR